MSYEITGSSERPNIRRAKWVTGKIQKKLGKLKFPCLYPGCAQSAISSHSQQKEGQLRAIAKNGLVYALDRNMFQHIKSMLREEGNCLFTEKGIQEASTFTGYCSQHDQMIFAPVEKQELIPGNPSQAALLFLRAISFEFATKRRANIQLDMLTDILGKDANPNWQEEGSAWLQGVKLFLNREGPFFLSQIFDIITKKDYKRFHTSWVRVPQTLPISVTTSVCPWLNDYYTKWSPARPQAMVSFSIIPASAYTDVVCSWLEYCHEDSLWIQREMETPKGLERIVNLFGIAESEDFCISIGFWESLPEDLRDLILFNMRHDAFRGPIADVPLIIKIK